MKLDVSDVSDLRPVLAAFARELLTEIDGDRGRLGYTEAQAAEAIGVAAYVLRDARRRGEIKGRLVGKKIVYARSELMKFLQSS